MNHTLGRDVCCTALKTTAMKNLVEEKGTPASSSVCVRMKTVPEARAVLFAARQARGLGFSRSAAGIVGPVQDDLSAGTHIRIHPLLDWTEINIWEYIKHENIPFMDLYLDRGDGTRYRSLGCAPCTTPIRSTAKTVDEIIDELRATNVAEQAGRAQDAGEAWRCFVRRIHVRHA